MDPKLRTALIAAVPAVVMLGLGAASAPLYRKFCQVTGYGGTTQRATAADAAAVKVSDGSISVRFDANVDPALKWKFAPEQVTQEMRIGTRRMAYFRAENLTDQPITGAASYNVEPEETAVYFKKIQCFCFTRQTLQPHQVVDMPVIYYVDPKISDDDVTRSIRQITLSYTFHIAPKG